MTEGTAIAPWNGPNNLTMITHYIRNIKIIYKASLVHHNVTDNATCNFAAVKTQEIN